jgi:SAM-dependent methyltransferase
MSSTEDQDIYTDEVVDRYLDFYGRGVDAFESLLIFSAAARLGENLLDVGCGPGITLDFIQPDPKHYLGLDSSAAMVRLARRRHPDYEFVHQSFEMWCSTRQFDMVLGGFGPLMHVDDLGPFAVALRRVLAPGGRFLLMGAGAPGQHVRLLDGNSPSTIYHPPDELVDAFGGQVFALGSLLVVTNA